VIRQRFDISAAAQASEPATARQARRAFTMLELQVALVVMAIGLLGIETLMIRQSKQVSRLEQWCVSSPTYYLVSQTDPYLRAMETPARLETQPGQTAWTPPVAQRRQYEVELLSSPGSANPADGAVQVHWDKVKKNKH
jgi:prepilin-type N-terminal cleavage/methylation domain-containing protein